MNLRTGTHQTIKRRLEVLEARQAPETVYIWREAGESAEAAIRRQSVNPGQDVVVCSWSLM